MSRCHEAYRRCASVALVLALVLIALPSFAQSDAVPKVELFVGYQWLNPGGNIPDRSTPPNAFKLPSIAQGFGTNLSYNFTKNLALEGNYGGDWNSHASISAFAVGPKYTWRGDGVNFFAHTLLGFERLSSRGINATNGVAAVLGGGMDVKIWKPLSLRLFEADYQLMRVNFSHHVPPNDSALRRQTYNGVRLTTGLVFNFGGAPELPVAAACSVDHPEVMVGEPVHATVAASNFNPKHTLTYTWASNGGKVDGKDTGATIDTNGVGGGSYTVTATVTDPKAKKNNTASCTANFTVKEPPKNPPQISCSASPSTVQPGSPATITCTCTSPDNVAVTVETPPVPPPQASKLNECLYPNEKKPWRVDNTCKAALDDVALKLQQDSDAKLVVVGNADPKEKRKNLAAERAVDVKAYISGGEAKQNIDPSRIETRTGTEGTMTSEQWIIPSGATFPEASSTTTVDESKVKAIPDHPKPAAKKAAAKKKAQ